MTLDEIKENKLYLKTFYYNGEADKETLLWHDDTFKNYDELSQEEKKGNLWIEKLTNYRGIKIIQMPKNWNSGFSPGNIICVSKNCGLFLIKHEYGHLQQKKIYGKKEYFFKVAFPSFLNFWLSKLKIKPLTYEEYHQQWWEAEADKLGGNKFWNNSIECMPLTQEQIDYIIENKKKDL